LRLVLFCHSLVSDWNHGNAHFLRGVVSELLARGHRVDAYEPANGWSLSNLIAEYGEQPVARYKARFPHLHSIAYDPATFDIERAVDGADAVIVHEWNEHDLVRRIGDARRRLGGFQLLFHDTHHRSVTAPEQMAAYDLSDYDGVLAFGAAVRDVYLWRGWAARAWIWHEAADAPVFRPRNAIARERDLVWIGNWGDDERTAEINEFLLEPVRELKLNAMVHGVRYPRHALDALAAAGIEYGGWLPNYEVPLAFARAHVTVHVPRRPYATSLPGVPTIRVFEALACGIPLVCAPWDDSEHLFSPGADYLVAHHGAEMRACLRAILNEPDFAAQLAEHGRRTILSRHTCRHRVDELLAILRELKGDMALRPEPALAAGD